MPSPDLRRGRTRGADPVSGLEAAAEGFAALAKGLFAVGCGLILAVIGLFVAGSAVAACWGMLFE